MKKGINRIEAAKEKATEEMMEMLDIYFTNHTEAVGNKKLTIDKIEDLLIEARKETEQIMKKASREVLKALEREMEKKRTVSSLRIQICKT